MELNYARKNHVITINDVDYEIPIRTAKMQAALNNLDKQDLSEYDKYTETVAILFGKNKVKKIFPEGEKTDLDFMEEVVTAALSLYYYRKTENYESKLSKDLERANPILEKIEKAYAIAELQK